MLVVRAVTAGQKARVVFLLHCCSVYKSLQIKVSRRCERHHFVSSSFLSRYFVTFVMDPGTSRSISLHRTTPSRSDALRNPSGSAMFFLGELRTPREMSQVTVCSSGFMAARAALLQHTGRYALLLPTSATLLLCGTALTNSSEVKHQPRPFSKRILDIPPVWSFSPQCTLNRPNKKNSRWTCSNPQACFKEGEQCCL